MNPRQRRGALLLGLAALGAVGVLVLVANYVADVRTQVEPFDTALELTADVAAFTPITPDLLTEVELPRRWMPSAALRDRLALEGMVAAIDLPRGALLQEGMVAPPPDIERSQREIAILVSAETGVAGKIGPGSIVDIYATFPEVGEADGSSAPSRAEIVVSGARIVEVGLPQPADPDDVIGAEFTDSSVVPITFSLSIRDSLVLAYVESFATQVRLGLRGPGDLEELPDDVRGFQPRLGELFRGGSGSFPTRSQTESGEENEEEQEQEPDPELEPEPELGPDFLEGDDEGETQP